MEWHRLSLDIPDLMDECILVVSDISYYVDDMPFDCPMLEITSPGFSSPVVFNDENGTILTKNSTYIFNACDLKQQYNNCYDINCSIADGIYIIRYSISPNDSVYVEYNHLRITKIMNMYYNVLCCLDKNRMLYEKVELKKRLNDFRLYLDGAKALVEFCHKPKEGMSLYMHSLDILSEIECKNC